MLIEIESVVKPGTKKECLFHPLHRYKSESGCKSEAMLIELYYLYCTAHKAFKKIILIYRKFFISIRKKLNKESVYTFLNS